MKLLKVVVIALVLSVPALVMAQAPSASTSPSKATDTAAAKAPTTSPSATTATNAPTTSPSATATKATTTTADTAANKVASTPDTKTFEGTISNINKEKNSFTLKDNTGSTQDIAYNMLSTLKTGDKVKVNVKKDGSNWTATKVESTTTTK
ncbi:MAG: hypothetical protein V2A66_10350 [Pseudomonadota bacterium]